MAWRRGIRARGAVYRYDTNLGCSRLNGWDENAQAWIETVRNDELESRRVATKPAVISAVRRLHPRRGLDVGWGEGWLTRALAGLGIEMTGVDGSERLIAAAQDGTSRFAVCGLRFAIMRRWARQGRLMWLAATSRCLTSTSSLRCAGSFRS